MNGRIPVLDALAAIDRARREARRVPSPAPRTNPATRWRRGGRDDAARAAHNTHSRQWRRDVAAAEFTPAVETRLLGLLAEGTAFKTALADVGLTHQKVFGRARWDTAWAKRLDEALLAGRDPNVRHGVDYRYRKGCHCPECRAAHDRQR